MRLANTFEALGQLRSDEQKITLEEISALRGSMTSSKGLGNFVVKQVAKLLTSVSFFIGLALEPGRDTGKFCQNYGHVVDYAKWVDSFPCCRDCGQEITSKEEMRRAVPRDMQAVVGKF